jgi:hypothetical protein
LAKSAWATPPMTKIGKSMRNISDFIDLMRFHLIPNGLKHGSARDVPSGQPAGAHFLVSKT